MPEAAQPASPIPPFRRRFLGPLALGLAGISALPLALSPQLARTALPEPLASMPYPAVLALSLVNPLILLVGAALAGGLVAHRIGLGSACAGTGQALSFRHAVQSVGIGLALALLLYALDRVLAPFLGPQAEALRVGNAGSVGALTVGMLYGGLTEEVLMRWGVMSLVAWTLQRVIARGALSDAGWWAAIAAAALIFAAGHLPALAALAEPTPALVGRTVLLNGLAGLVYGALFWRRQLESAMLAHATTHVGFWLLARAA